jgi:hypothetical protein
MTTPPAPQDASSDSERAAPNQLPQSSNVSDRERLSHRQIDQDRTLEAIQALEATVGRPAPGRELAWRDGVLASLDVLAEATREEAENAGLPDSLLSDIARTQPRLRNRVRGLRIQYRQLQEAIDRCRRDVAGSSNVGFAEVRDDVARLLTGFRDQRAKESDLLYEAYYDAFRSDLPQDAERDLGSS